MNHSDLRRDPARLWQRAREGQVTAVLGRLPDPPADLRVLRVSCEVAPAALRPLLEARRLTEAIVGEARSQPRARPTRRRTLFGESQERATEAVVVELWNHLAKLPGARWVVVFDAVELADEATIAALIQIVRRPGWMQAPLLLVFHGAPGGAAAELLAAVQARGGDAALRGEEPQASEPQAIEWRALPPKVLRVLRAGALIGPGFEARIVAELLSLEPLAVLERLQQAIDLGVPVEDRGEGRFSLPTGALSALSASLMPSLAQAWHRKLGRLLGARAGEEAATARPARPPVPRSTRTRAPIAPPGDGLGADIIDLSAEVIDLAAETEEAGARDMSAGAASEQASKDMSAGAASEGAAGPLAAPGGAPGRRRTILVTALADEPAGPAEAAAPASAGAQSGDPLVDEARAAEHLRLAGEFDAAAQHLCEAARRAMEMGAPQAAVQHAREALALLATLPASAARRRWKVAAQLELGRVQWQAAGFDHGFTLAQALATLEAARAELDAGAPAELAVELAQALAGVCYDLGDADSLARALAELEAATALLREAGDPIGAACLLNDQAAVLVRLGTPGRALQLLRESRRVFDARAGEDPAALRELAETEHQFARLPLHVQLRPGREQEGFEMGLGHALAAERAYRELGEARELGRVWETMGRLELRRGRIDAARERLEAALEVLTPLGDLTGLAQTTEALSEVLAASGRDAEAIALLRDSVVFNRDKGSPLGLTLNRRTFTGLAQRLAGQPQHAEGLQQVAILLSAGERELGLAGPPAG